MMQSVQRPATFNDAELEKHGPMIRDVLAHDRAFATERSILRGVLLEPDLPAEPARLVRLVGQLLAARAGAAVTLEVDDAQLMEAMKALGVGPGRQEVGDRDAG